MQIKGKDGDIVNAPAVKNITKVFVLITYITMIAVNGLANALPINGLNTGEVSDSYPNLFAPAGLTFAIWGVIYVLLGVHVLYQTGLFQSKDKPLGSGFLNKIAIVFSVSSLLNATWIFAWHYQIVPLSFALLSMLLLCLIAINKMIDKEKLSLKERFFIRLPFSIYFGWVTVATIANATTLLVSLNWNRFGLSEVLWTVIILFVGLIIGVATVIRNRNMAYGLVLIWSYFGIWTKHASFGEFEGQYRPIIITLLFCLVIFVATEIYLIYSTKKSVAG